MIFLIGLALDIAILPRSREPNSLLCLLNLPRIVSTCWRASTNSLVVEAAMELTISKSDSICLIVSSWTLVAVSNFALFSCKIAIFFWVS